MAAEVELIGAGAVVLVNIMAVAASWGDMRRRLLDFDERQDERHGENTTKLDRIDEQVRKINGVVARHDEQIKTHSAEIERLRRGV